MYACLSISQENYKKKKNQIQQQAKKIALVHISTVITTQFCSLREQDCTHVEENYKDGLLVGVVQLIVGQEMPGSNFPPSQTLDEYSSASACLHLIQCASQQ